MERPPKVSVVISTYNQPGYLCEAIDSVLAQTYTDYEIIVVDDGSTEETREAVKKYGDKIRYFYQGNQGATRAEDFGIRQARGEYIASLDHDDLWMPDLLEKQVELLERDPGLAFVCAAVYTMDARGGITGTYESGRYCECVFASLLEDNFVQHSTVVLRKKYYFDAGGFDADFTVNHDHDLWLRLAKKHRFAYRPLLLAKYRLHDRNITKRLDTWLRDSLKIFQKAEIMEGVALIMKRKCVARTYYKFGGFYGANHEFFKAGVCYLKAVLYYPLIGAEYWPKETERFSFTLPYRVIKVYFLVIGSWLRAVLGLVIPAGRKRIAA